MKVIVGIGNPDKEYLETRHNVGWMFLDWLQRKYQFSVFNFQKSINAEVSEGKIDETKIQLAKPRTYVNKSGEAAKKAIENYKLKIENLIVVQDDLDIPFGKCKLSFDRNSGGHKGIDSIVNALKTTQFHRIRIGLGTKALTSARALSDSRRDEWVRDFVLKKFTTTEQKMLSDVFAACEIRLLQILR